MESVVAKVEKLKSFFKLKTFQLLDLSNYPFQVFMVIFISYVEGFKYIKKISVHQGTYFYIDTHFYTVEHVHSWFLIYTVLSIDQVESMKS